MIDYLSETCQVYDRLSIMNETLNIHWLRSLRQRARLTQEDLAARLQSEGWAASRSAINNWENNKNEPPLSDPRFRTALSRATRTQVHTILRLAGFEVDQPVHSFNAEQAATLIDQLPQDKQELALRLLEQIART